MNLCIKNLYNVCQNNINIVNDFLCKRVSKIQFQDILYYIGKLISDPDNSSVTVSSDLRCDKITTATASAFKKKRTRIPY